MVVDEIFSVQEEAPGTVLERRECLQGCNRGMHMDNITTVKQRKRGGHSKDPFGSKVEILPVSGIKS